MKISLNLNSRILLLFFNCILASQYCVAQQNEPGHELKKIPAKLTLIAGSVDGQGANDGAALQAHFSHAFPEGYMIAKGIAIDSHDNLFIADIGNHVIRKISTGNVVSTFAGKPGTAGYADGIGGRARFNDPIGLAIDKDDNLYVADSGNDAIRKIAADGTTTTLIGPKPNISRVDLQKSSSILNNPIGIALDKKDGNLFVVDSGTSTIKKVFLTGKVEQFAGDVNGLSGFKNGYRTAARFNKPTAISISSDGSIWVVDADNDAIRKIDTNGDVTTPICSFQMDSSVCENQMRTISGYLSVFPASKNQLYISTTGGIYLLDESTGKTNTIKRAINSDFDEQTPEQLLGTVVPGCFAKDSAGIIYFADDTVVGKIDAANHLSLVAGSFFRFGSQDGRGENATFNHPNSLAVDHHGNIFVADTSNAVIRKINKTGEVSTFAGTLKSRGVSPGKKGQGKFDRISYLRIDSHDNLYASDVYNKLIEKITPDGNIEIIKSGNESLPANHSYFGFEKLNLPGTITISNQGILYVVDGNLLKKMDLQQGNLAIVPINSALNEVNTNIKNVGIPTRIFFKVFDMSAEPQENLVINENGRFESVDSNGLFHVIGEDSITVARAHGKDLNLLPGSFAIGEKNEIYYIIGSKIRVMDSQGKIIGEIDARGDAGSSLESLDELGYPAEIVHLEGNEFVVLIGNAILKLSLTENTSN